MQPRRLRALALLAAAALLVPLSGCAAWAPGSDSGAVSAAPDPAPSRSGASEAAPETAPNGAGAGGADAAAGERSVVRTGDATIRVADASAAADAVAGIAEELGGRVESQTLARADGSAPAGGSLVIRVPADRLDDAFDALASVGTVVSEQRSATDVTAEHVDLRARVAALEDSVDRLRDLMSGAATTADLLEAESALAERQQELDGLRAQLEALEGQVEEATVWVSLTTRSALPGGPANFWEGLLAGVDSLAAAGSGALVIAGILLPWLALGGVAALLVVVLVRRGRRRRKLRSEARGDAG